MDALAAGLIVMVLGSYYVVAAEQAQGAGVIILWSAGAAGCAVFLLGIL